MALALIEDDSHDPWTKTGQGALFFPGANLKCFDGATKPKKLRTTAKSAMQVSQIDHASILFFFIVKVSMGFFFGSERDQNGERA